MDDKNSLMEIEKEQDVKAIKKAPVVAPARKAVKKKSTITKLVLIGIALLVGAIFAFVPMRFGLTQY
ncbi:MAG: hypothetical protein K2O94_05470, partial [Clostridiales bacterium]|nr:hypothetical protein [Clostridiales bacterium]